MAAMRPAELFIAIQDNSDILRTFPVGYEDVWRTERDAAVPGGVKG